MRELTKSIFSFSWAISLFGVQQTVNLFTPSKAARSFNEVTGAAREQFSGLAEATFKAGDNLQRAVIDQTFGLFTLEALNPSRWAKLGSEVMQQAMGVVGQVAPCDAGGKQQPTGWGPVPPPDAR